MNRTDKQAWLCLAKRLPKISGMHAAGLCWALTELWWNTSLPTSQMWRMRKQLRGHFGHLASHKHPWRGFYWKPGDIKSRVKACHKLARMCE